MKTKIKIIKSTVPTFPPDPTIMADLLIKWYSQKEILTIIELVWIEAGLKDTKSEGEVE